MAWSAGTRRWTLPGFVGGGIASSSFILFFTCIGIPIYVAYFVCDSASEFGAIGSTSFLECSYPNLLLVFSEPVIFRNLYDMFFASVGLCLGLFYFILFFCTLFWVSVWKIRFFALKSKKEKGTG